MKHMDACRARRILQDAKEKHLQDAIEWRTEERGIARIALDFARAAREAEKLLEKEGRRLLREELRSNRS